MKKTKNPIQDFPGLQLDMEYSADLAHIVADMVQDIVQLADRNGVGRYNALCDVCTSLNYISENANLATYRQTVAGEWMV